MVSSGQRRSISPVLTQSAIIRRTDLRWWRRGPSSARRVAGRLMQHLYAVSGWRRTPRPSPGRRHGEYALAWSRSSSPAREENSVGVRGGPDSKHDLLPGQLEVPTSPHSSRTRCINPIGSVGE